MSVIWWILECSAFLTPVTHTSRSVPLTHFILKARFSLEVHQLYRIQLKAWSHCDRTAMVQDDRNGITGGTSFYGRTVNG
jgi:hypothetical protein